MTESSRPWTGTTIGDKGPYSSDNWAQLERYMMGDASNVESGPILGSGVAPDTGLTVAQRGAGANMSVDVSTGAALVNGTFYFSDATVNLVISANASGNTRIDTIVLNKDWSAQTVRLLVVAGTPAASPVPPTLVQSAGIQWQIPLADVTVASGAVSIVTANIQIRKSWSNISDGIYLQGMLNNSGVVLQHGDVVVLDTTADRAITTTTVANNKIALGVVIGRVPIGGYCRVQVGGVGYVNVNGATTRGQWLATSGTAKQAAPATLNSAQGQFAVALQTTGGAGLCLAFLRQLAVVSPFTIKADITEATDSNSAAEITMYTTSVPGGVIGANDSIIGEFWFTMVQNSGVGRTLTFRVKYGGTTVLTFTTTWANPSATAGMVWLRFYMKNAGATNSQKVIGVLYRQDPTSNNTLGAQGTAAIDSTTAQTLAVTLQSDAATATQTYTLQNSNIQNMGNI